MRIARRALPAILLIVSPTLAAADLDVKAMERNRVLNAADAYLKQQPTPITQFHAARSAGGPHDYFSEGDYWWPDPENPNGPYVQKDGMTNPDNFIAHRHAMMQLSIQTAALAALPSFGRMPLPYTSVSSTT